MAHRATILFGSTMGNTEEVAQTLHELMPEHTFDPIDVCVASVHDFANAQFLMLGIPTWFVGQLQDDWEGFVGDIADLDCSGKRIALFGCGDQLGYPDNFGDAMGILAELLEARGATIVGFCSTDGYKYAKSLAERGDQFVGLLVDRDRPDPKADERIAEWAERLKTELFAS